MSAVPNLPLPDPWSLFSLSGLANGDIDGYLDRLVSRVAAHFSANGATLFLPLNVPGVFVLRSKSGTHSTVPEGAKIVTGSGIAGRVLSNKQPRILGSLADEPGFQDLAPSGRAAIKSSMVVPLVDPVGELAGVLNVSRGNDQPVFCAQDLNMATGIASLVTLALTNARLVEHFVLRTKQAMSSEEKLQAVFDSVWSAIVVYDKHFNIQECNAAAADLVSSATGTWVGDEEVAAVLPSLLRLTHDKKGTNTTTVVTKGGTSWMLTATPLKNGGVVLTVLDISEAEKSVRKSERLHRLAEIGQMTAALAHEIRNPLTGIKSAAQMIQENPESTKEYIGVVIEETMRLNNLCDEFLSFAKPMEVQLEPFRLIEAVERVVLVHLKSFDAAHCTLQVVDQSNGAMVKGDRPKIEQVLHNLVRNALQACKAGSRVTVTVSPVGFTVEDDGAGMSSLQIERLFSPFFTTKSTGVGLGLCTVKKILDSHNATIEVDSKLGHGSIFKVSFVSEAKA